MSPAPARLTPEGCMLDLDRLLQLQQQPEPHIVLEQGFDYPGQALYLDQYIVIDAAGGLSVYRNWFQDYSPEQIAAELSASGFAIHSLWDDLIGTPQSDSGEWIGVVAQKASAAEGTGLPSLALQA